MNKVEKIRAEIERLKSSLPWGSCASQVSMECNCKDEAYNEILSYIDSLEEEPVSNDLDSFAKEYSFNIPSDIYNLLPKEKQSSWIIEIENAVKAGAQWQKEQMMKNSTFINEVEWGDDIHKLFREKGKKVKLTIIKDENY